MSVETAKKLEFARHATIANLGIGGHVKSEDFFRFFKNIDAPTFARIMYATEQMLEDYDGTARVDPMNIPLMIEKYDFDQKPHFHQVLQIFKRYFGEGSAQA